MNITKKELNRVLRYYECSCGYKAKGDTLCEMDEDMKKHLKEKHPPRGESMKDEALVKRAEQETFAKSGRTGGNWAELYKEKTGYRVYFGNERGCLDSKDFDRKIEADNHFRGLAKKYNMKIKLRTRLFKGIDIEDEDDEDD